MMRRREFITLVGGWAATPIARPHTARAQQAGKVPTIGFLGAATPSVAGERVGVFERRLGELGWIDGQTVAIEYRWAQGKTERFSELAAELVRLKVDVIMTWGTATATAVKQATSSVPVVFTIVGDPVGSGLVASLARPGGNITGLSTQHDDAASKRLELLREIVPTLRRLAIMANASNSGSMLELRQVEAAAQTLSLVTIELKIQQADDIAPAFAALKGRADALYVAADALFNTSRVRINTLALGAQLPTVHGFREIVAAGGLLSYAPNYQDLFRRAADYVDKILRGAKPSDIPVEQPTKFDFVVNLRTAKALGLTIPEAFLLRADEVIE
jgi:putative ABC transport system substrate-binding protein